MTAASDSYRLERWAQDERFNTRHGAGGVDASMAQTEEYRAYFGLGEFAGSGVEERLTFKTWLESQGRERSAAERAADVWQTPEVTPEPTSEGWIKLESAFWLSGADLRELAAAGDGNARAEIERRRVRRLARRGVS